MGLRVEARLLLAHFDACGKFHPGGGGGGGGGGRGKEPRILAPQRHRLLLICMVYLYNGLFAYKVTVAVITIVRRMHSSCCSPSKYLYQIVKVSSVF